jgi:hypothetical protein
MCCDGNDASPSNTVGTCPTCGGDVDADGYTTEESCNYSPRCETCGAAPCDGSC